MLLNVREVAVMLRVSQPTVRKLCATGILKSVKLSARALRVPKEAVDAYLRTLSSNEVGVDSTAPDAPREARPRAR